MPLTLFFILCIGALSVSSSPPSPYVLHESRPALPRGWTPLRRAPSDLVLPLRIGLVQPNTDNIESYLLDVSDPVSLNYGNHWSPAKVVQMFRPAAESVNATRTWLTDENISPSRIKLSNSGGWIEANVTVAEAESLLMTEYNVYRHSSGIERIAAGTAYYLPEHVSRHVDLVIPTIHFDVQLKQENHMKRSTNTFTIPPKTTGPIQNVIDELSNCDQHITPNCLRALYDFVYTPVATHNNTFGIAEYAWFTYVPSDLDLFFANFSTSQVGQRPIFDSVDGGPSQPWETGVEYNTESSLDFEYAMALVGKNQPVTLYQVGDVVYPGSFNNLLDAFDGSYCTFEGGDTPGPDGTFPDPRNGTGAYKGPEACGTLTPPYVLSTSYNDNEADLTPFYTARECIEYAKLGLMGVTVLYSSGDYGVAGNGAFCITPSDNDTTTEIFNPTFPSTCPFITAVGATQMVPGSKVTDPETACEDHIYSGGGFSNQFAIPEYQKSAVNSFLKNHPPPYSTSIWNATGSRAYPDISANGAKYVVAIDGSFSLVYGTSCATPVVGAMLTAVNDARLAVGKRPVGFINPAIYSAAFQGAFHDITNGTNPGCGTAGFSAVPGWDPVTGLGTPDFPQLLTRFHFLP